MKSRYTAYLLLSCLPFFSCSKSSVKPGARFELLSDAIVQGAPVAFRFNLDDADKQYYNSQPLFTVISCFSSNDADSTCEIIIRLTPELKGQFIVPGNAATVNIDLSTKENFLSAAYSSGTIVVQNKNLQPVRKARTYLLWKSLFERAFKEENEREIVDSLFNAERSSYPDDLAIFGCRWIYELRTGSLDTVKIRKDLAIISDFRGHNNADAWFYMGSFLRMLAIKHHEAMSGKENDTRKNYSGKEFVQLSRQYPVPDTIISKKNNPIFNDPLFVNWLLSMRGVYYVVSSESEWNDEIQKIILANPASMYTEMLFASGKYIFISPEIALHAADEMLNQNPYPLYKYYKMRILSQSYPDRRAECFSLIKELKAIVHKDTYFEEGVDPFHFFYKRRIEPYLVEGDLLAKSGMYDSAITALRDAQGIIDDPLDISHAIVFSQCSEYFWKKGSIDSSTKYMVAAAKFASGKKFILDTLHARYGRAKSRLDYNSWIKEIEKTLPAETYVLVPKTILKVQLGNGTALNFEKLGDTVVVIECWSVGCSFCTQNLQQADNFIKQKHPKKIQVLVASSAERELDERMKTLHIDLPVIKNGGDIVRAFSIHSYPETIVIRGGRIIGRYSGTCNIEDIVNLSQ